MSSSSSGEATSATGESGAEATGESESDSSTFVPPGEPDLPRDCDMFEQNCAVGEKCVPWLKPDGSSWIGFTCVSVVGSQSEGEPCTFDFADSSDDCDSTSSCFSFGLFDNDPAGRCHSFCTGSFDAPSCMANQVCLIGNGYPGPSLCIPKCDPLAQGCVDEQACLWLSGFFACSPHAGVAPGAPCDSFQACAPGSMCMQGARNSDCAQGCCAPFCSLELGNGACAALPGTSCVPFFEPGLEPPGYADVGVCGLP